MADEYLDGILKHYNERAEITRMMLNINGKALRLIDRSGANDNSEDIAPPRATGRD